ncbi:MAG: hypothetical protein QM426_04945 [Euryarchaeota archaeon]|nr:hypothetical protein [Euryarchaeota archaeon]
MNLDPELIIDEIVDELEKSRVTFLVGAGISALRTSHVPAWGELVSEILTHIAGLEKKDEINYVLSYNELLFNEVIFKIISEVLGVDDTVSLLKCSIDNDNFNLIHAQLAYFSAYHGAEIITPNFDELLEKSHKFLKLEKPLNITKVHGTVSNLYLARFTVDNIFKPLNDEISEKVKSNLKGKLLVVMGYRGADTFDLMPLLTSEDYCPDKIIWFTRNKEKAEIKNNNDLFKRNIVLVEGVFDNYLEKLFNIVIRRDTSKLNISPDWWKVSITQNTSKLNISPDWWKVNIAQFFNKLSPEKLSLQPFLWARILEHVKGYNIYGDDSKDKNNYAVLNAFTSYIEKNDDLPVNYIYLYSKAHLLYTKRIAGIDVSNNDFSELINNIETQLKEYNSYELQSLLGWVYHQYAVSLQSNDSNDSNDGNYFQARLMLLKACEIRTKLNDPEYVFSLFQLFMNAYNASKKNNWEVDELVPIGWRKWMIHEMERYSKIFTENYKYELNSTNLHNLGCLYQYLAFEKHTKSEMEEKYLSLATKYYKEALKVRMHLCDKRLVAQSKIRICQSYFLLVKRANHDISEYYSEIEEHIKDIEAIYKRIPQEDFRYNDLKELKQELVSWQFNFFISSLELYLQGIRI